MQSVPTKVLCERASACSARSPFLTTVSIVVCIVYCSAGSDGPVMASACVGLCNIQRLIVAQYVYC